MESSNVPHIILARPLCFGTTSSGLLKFIVSPEVQQQGRKHVMQPPPAFQVGPKHLAENTINIYGTVCVLSSMYINRRPVCGEGFWQFWYDHVGYFEVNRVQAFYTLLAAVAACEVFREHGNLPTYYRATLITLLFVRTR